MNLNETSVLVSPEDDFSSLKYLHICRLEGLLGGNCRGGAVSREETIKGGLRCLIAWHSQDILTV